MCGVEGVGGGLGVFVLVFFFRGGGGIRYIVGSRGLGDVYESCVCVCVYVCVCACVCVCVCMCMCVCV